MPNCKGKGEVKVVPGSDDSSLQINLFKLLQIVVSF